MKLYNLFRTDSPKIIIHCTLFRTERTKTIPCPAAHPRTGYIIEYFPWEVQKKHGPVAKAY